MKILVVSNNAFEMQNSNGRTLGNLLKGIQKKNLMQFCIKGNNVSAELIRHAYKISDAQMVKGLLLRKIYSKRLLYESADKDSQRESKSRQWKLKPSRSPITMLLREFIWRSGIQKVDFFEKAVSFSPDIIMLQLGDNAFMADLCRLLAAKSGAKVVVFTSEDYYFKEWNYLKAGSRQTLLFRIFLKTYKKAVQRLFANTALCVTLTPMLAQRYAKEFDVPVEIIMQSAGEFEKQCNKNIVDRIVYAGNLDLERHRSLLEIAKVLSEICPQTIVEIYGNVSQKQIEVLAKEENIRWKGFISYEKVKTVMQSSRLVIHTESFLEFYRKDLCSAFSTKIADSLACGVPLFLYAPEEMAVTKYLQAEQCAFVCSEKSKLKEMLLKALSDECVRKEILEKAKQVVLKNHDINKNHNIMVQCLKRSIYSKDDNIIR